MFATPLHQHTTPHLNIQAPVRHYRLTAFARFVLDQNARLNWLRENAIEARNLEACRLAMQAAGYRVVETPFVQVA